MRIQEDRSTWFVIHPKTNMFTVTVRDHLMVAHSLKGEVFGPANRLHGATFIVDAEFKKTSLNDKNIVIDMGMASSILKSVTGEINYRNLDELEMFGKENTSTEFLAFHIHREIGKKCKDQFSGSLKVTLQESHIASASYEGPIE